jgi:TatD DNase family protein
VDTHCHLDITAAQADRGEPIPVDEALAAAAAVGVTRVIQIGCDLRSARWSVDFVQSRDEVWAAVALHPNDAPRIQQRHGRAALEEAWAEIAELANHPRVQAVGETGMDFFRTAAEGRDIQEESFRRHIQIAKDLGKTLVIHDRDSHDDVLRILLDEGAPERVVFHCFSGDGNMAAIVAAHGWYLSFAGVVTFASSLALREALTIAPLDRILVETDAPYLTPVPYRGQVNASYLIPITARLMADVRGIDEMTLSQALWDNAARAFTLP